MDLLKRKEFLEQIKECECIFIDEGQFFADLNEFVEHFKYDKEIYIATLDLDFKKEYFEAVILLFLNDHTIKKLKSNCDNCTKPTGIYTYRKGKNKTNSIIDIDTGDNYGASCEKCYDYLNVDN